MKNLLNYLNDYFDENIDEKLCNINKKNKIHVSKDEANEWQLKANRAASRREEIEKHGKLLNYSNIYNSNKKKYTRKSKHKNNNY